MKKITLLLIALVFSVSLKASHIAGCDLTYTCIGGNQYQITLAFFRDCSGVSADNAVTIYFQSSCGNFTATLQRIPGTGQEITPVCPGQSTTCASGSLYGLQQYVYRGTVTLTPCSNWTMYYTTCCRNPSNTISNATSASMYIPATLNSVAAPCNSSPQFSNTPSTIICRNQNFCYNHGAIDPDGDSLVYSLVTPYDEGPTGNMYVTYMGGYSANQPLPSNPPVTINPVTGDICMRPTTNITTVFAVLVEEWRRINGVPVKIGSVLRDMQLTVINCTNALPTLAGINPSASQYSPADTTYTYTLCAGQNLQFYMYPHDDNAANNLTITCNNGIPDATISLFNNGTPNALGHFNWTPNSGDVSTVPHCFTATIADNGCPYIGLQTFSYCITVAGIGITLNPPGDTVLCWDEDYTLTAHADTSAFNFVWTINGTQVTPLNDTTLHIDASTLGPGTHTISVTANNSSANCAGANTVEITVIGPLNLNVTPPAPTICNGDTTSLTVSGALYYDWSPATGISGTTGDSIAAFPSTTTVYTVSGSDNHGCTGQTSVQVSVYFAPTIQTSASPVNICVGDSSTLTALGAVNCTWLPPNGLSSTIGNIVHASPLATTVYTVTGDNNGCIGTGQVTLNVYPYPEVNFSASPTEGCEDLLVQFADLTQGNIVSWFWDFGDDHVSTLQNPMNYYINPGSYDVSLSVSNAAGCITSMTFPQMITVYQLPLSFFTLWPEVASELEPTVHFFDASVGASAWEWDFGEPNVINNNSNLKNPNHTYQDTGWYNVMHVAITEFGCRDTSWHSVRIDPNISFYVPNAFTPNSDSRNQNFVPKGEGIEWNTFEMKIFDRWGKQIYYTRDHEYGWDGKINGSNTMAEQGSYSWLIRFTDVKHQTHVLKGFLVLIK